MRIIFVACGVGSPQKRNGMIYRTYSEAVANNGLFYFGKPCLKHPDWKRRVSTSKCIYCHKESVLSNRDPEKHRESSLASYHKNKEKHQQSRSQNRKIAYQANPSKIAAYAKDWQTKNPGRVAAIKARRRASLLLATPKWAKDGDIWDALVCIYSKCPKGMEVDHIVPLQGKTVCGLHVPWNLQYLTKSQNSSKGNRLQD